MYKKTELKKIKQKKLSSIQEILNLGLLSESVWLAGGALRTLVDSEDVVCDFDIFFKSSEAIVDTKNKLSSAGFENIYECPNGFLFTYRKDSAKIQLVCRSEYTTPERLLDTFDFTAACAATDGNVLYYTFNFVKDVKHKKLRLHGLTYPVATLKRIVKYSRKGYKISEVAKEFVTAVNKAGEISEDGMIGYID